MRNTVRVLSMEVDVCGLSAVVDKIHKFVNIKKSAYVCLSNVHMCMETFDDIEFRQVVNNADIVVPDGRPIYWAQRFLSKECTGQVRGQDLMSALCKRSVDSSLNIGLYGGASKEILNCVERNLRESYPGINIVYSFSPPFRSLSSIEDESVIRDINSSNVDILFVGIGCPKQERWMAGHKQQLNCVQLGVGAAFDFISGAKRHSPRWMQRVGLEWMFRLISEPRRLWKRYLKQNPRFVYFIAKQFIKGN